MSKIALSGNPSGTGTFTIASPNSNTDRTLTLPDVAGTVAVASSGTPNNTTFLRGDNTWAVVEGIPSGSVIYFAANTAPTGYLKANGAAVSRTTYAALFAAIGTTYGAGDGSTTFNLPDLRGEFVRGFDDGRGVDSGRAFGSAQGDAIRNITGQIDITRGAPTQGTGAFTVTGSIFGGGTSYSAGRFANFDASLVVPTANENRPRNVAMLACIKF